MASSFLHRNLDTTRLSKEQSNMVTNFIDKMGQYYDARARQRARQDERIAKNLEAIDAAQARIDEQIIAAHDESVKLVKENWPYKRDQET